MTEKIELPEVVRYMIATLGVSDTITIIEKIGGMSWYISDVNSDKTPRTEKQAYLLSLLGERLDKKIRHMFPSTWIYIPNCKQALRLERNKIISKTYEEMYFQGDTDRTILMRLTKQYNLSSNQIWRIVNNYRPSTKKPAHQQPDLFSSASG